MEPLCALHRKLNRIKTDNVKRNEKILIKEEKLRNYSYEMLEKYWKHILKDLILMY